MSDTRTRDHGSDASDASFLQPTTTPERVESQFAQVFEAEFAPRLAGVDLTRMPRLADIEPHFSGGAPQGDAPAAADVRHKLIVLWADVAVRHAIVRRSEDPDELIATVTGLPGAWGAGASPDEALSDLHDVLIGWASLKLDDGDRDIPDMEGIRLVLDA